MAVPRKKLYLDAAEQDRERYAKEFNAYKQTDAYKIFTQAQTEKKMKDIQKDDTKTVNNTQNSTMKDDMNKIKVTNSEKETDFGNFDIPIFTEEFLDHNKTREAELRQLRKSNIDYEQQNSILQKHIENMKTAIDKLETETLQQRNNNTALQQHLEHLRKTLTNSFSNIRLPG